MTLTAKCIRCGQPTKVPATSTLPVVHQTCQVLPKAPPKRKWWQLR